MKAGEFDLRFCALVLTIFCCARSFAQDLPRSETQLLNDKILVQKLGKDWRGIIFVCDPYCEFISLKEEQLWNPAIGERRIRLEKLQAVAQTDRLYPLLITHLPVLPFVESKGGDQGIMDQNAAEKLRPPPEYAVTSYGIGWSLRIGEKLTFMQLSSNTEIQSALAPEKYFLLPSLMGTLALRPHGFYKWWIQHSLEGNFATGTYQTKDAFEVNTSSQYATYKMLNFGRQFRTGPRLTWRTEAVKLKSDSLTHFSYTWNSYLLGWEAVWNRWSLTGDFSVMNSMKERQSFRESPLRQTWFRLGTGYCSRDFSIFDIRFGFCSNLDYIADRQKAGLSNNLIASESKIDINRWELGISLRVGEDFFK